MDTLIKQLRALGRLHDCVVSNVIFDYARGSVGLRVEDMLAGVREDDDQLAPAPATLVFSDCLSINVCVDTTEKRLRIYEVTIEPGAGGYACIVSFWPGGRLEILAGSAELNRD